jgi:hypothetical protein
MWRVEFAFNAHAQFFERIQEFHPLMKGLNAAIRKLGSSVGVMIADHSNRKNPAHGPLDYLDSADRLLTGFHELVPEIEKTSAYTTAKLEVDRLMLEARKALA